MAGLREIKDRITNIEESRKITNAMYLISSNKLKKAKKLMEDTEPYFFQLQATMARTFRHIPPGTDDMYIRRHFKPEGKRPVRAFLILTGDKGLAGSYNHTIIEAAEKEIFRKEEETHDPLLWIIGELGRHYFSSRYDFVDEAFHYPEQDPTMGRARRVAQYMIDAYTSERVDEIVVVYSVMRNAFASDVIVEKLLPVHTATFQELRKIPADVIQEEFILKPSPEAVLDNIMPIYLTGFVYSAMVEGFCCVQNARMMAMSSANHSAAEMIRSLSAAYNRERQSRITSELTEIVSGANALSEKRS